MTSFFFSDFLSLPEFGISDDLPPSLSFVYFIKLANFACRFTDLVAESFLTWEMLLLVAFLD